tara:strand:- start:165 stop:284 length:120 start_codon:yes stop_codon:yes gene_type:complete
MENKKEKMNYLKVIINFLKKLFRSKKKEEKSNDDTYPLW